VPKKKQKVVSRVINKELEKSSINKKNIELRWGWNKILNPRATAELFNSYFVEIVKKLKEKIVECTEPMIWQI